MTTINTVEVQTTEQSICLANTSMLREISESVSSAMPSQMPIVAVDGFYGAGKTSFTNALVLLLEALGNRCLVLGTDDFMRFSRADRAQSVERYTDHVNWYDLRRLDTCLHELRENPSCEIFLDRLYNHTTGELDASRTISGIDIDVVVLEGMYAFHESLRHHIDLGIVILARHDVLLQRVIHRDSTERRLGEQFVRERYWIINGEQYQSHVQTCLRTAHIIVDNSEDELTTIVGTNGVGSKIFGRSEVLA